MATKTITARGKQVQVDDFDVVGSSVPARRLKATIGSVEVEKILTFGAMDGSRIMPTQAQLQIDLDRARQEVADEAAWRKELGILLQAVD